MKQYTQQELIGNILLCSESESHLIEEPYDGEEDRVKLINQNESKYVQERYPIHIINTELQKGRWSLIPSKALDNYEIY